MVFKIYFSQFKKIFNYNTTIKNSEIIEQKYEIIT